MCSHVDLVNLLLQHKAGFNSAESTTALSRFLLGLTSATEDQVAAAKELGIEYSTERLADVGLLKFMEDMLEPLV